MKCALCFFAYQLKSLQSADTMEDKAQNEKIKRQKANEERGTENGEEESDRKAETKRQIAVNQSHLTGANS